MFNVVLYKYKVQTDFKTYLFIFPKIEDFKVSFQILKTIGQPMVQKITLKEFIQFESREIVYIWINYTGLFKRCSFVITTIYLAVIYTILNNNIPKIAILMNSIKKRLKFNKNTQLRTIYKCVDIMYIITDITKAFVIITTTFSIFSNFFSTV